MTTSSLPACAVLLAGGRGTRFWPRSRARTPKQLLNIIGRKTMLRQTLARLRPIFPAKRIWVVTSREQAAACRRELPELPRPQILAEPMGRNTAAAIALAAMHLARAYDDALMAVLPADHFITNEARYRRLVRAALELAQAPGRMVVLGIPPTRPDTGFGYIERGKRVARPGGFPAYAVRRFTEKPSRAKAAKYIASRRYFWNAGMFFWRVRTFLENLRRFLPATHDALSELAHTIGKPSSAKALRRIYPRLESISVDYALMEPATRERSPSSVYVLPADVGWSDIGSWTSVYELLAKKPGENVSAGNAFTLDASGNFFWSLKKFVAAIGIHNLVLVETEDALLLCSRDRAQDVGRIVQWLERNRRWDMV